MPHVGELADAQRDLFVVDGVLEPIRQSRVRDFELDVVEEHLPCGALVLRDAVMTEDLEPVQLDLDHAPTTAAATVSASTCSRTSCARMIVAPRS